MASMVSEQADFIATGSLFGSVGLSANEGFAIQWRIANFHCEADLLSVLAFWLYFLPGFFSALL